MVEWKGEINQENSGQKAALLDQIQDLEVPNFFTITKKETKQLIKNHKNPEQIKNKEIPEQLASKIEKAYKEVGISSEVRKSSGKARNLVGGQRNNQKVSIRVSNSKPGSTEYRLNVGKSSLEKAIKNVIASFYKENQEEEYPAIIIQKMIEPEKTGALINNYDQRYQLLESVEGLGTTLEKGTTTPDFYLLRNNRIEERKIAKTQIRTTRHPLNGNHRKKQIDKKGEPYEDNEIQKLSRKASSQDISVKYAYKRGTFYITDAFTNKTSKLYQERQPTLKLIKASGGEITGTIGREIKTADKPLPPQQYRKILFARNGSYTGKQSQKARRQNKTLVVSYQEELSNGQHIEQEESQQKQQQEETATASIQNNSQQITATKIMPIDQGNPSINTQPPFTEGYSITSLSDTKGKTINRENYLTSYQEVFAHRDNGNKNATILDARKLSSEGLIEAIKYIEADKKIILIDKPAEQVIKHALENRYDVIGVEPSKMQEISQEVARQEKKLILNHALKEK